MFCRDSLLALFEEGSVYVLADLLKRVAYEIHVFISVVLDRQILSAQSVSLLKSLACANVVLL